jgi:hypothetical protein
MSLSDGVYRSIPCFSHPELAEAIVKGYHGEGFTPVIPVAGDFVFRYSVTWRDLWSEVNLCQSSVDLSVYKGIVFELDKSPSSGSLHVKIYGDADGKEQYVPFNGATGNVTFDSDVLGTKAERITLQKLVEGEVSNVIKNVSLIRHDGTLEESVPSVFWGSSLELIVS